MPQTRDTDPDRATFEALLEELYAARAAGDLERLCALFSPEALFRIAGSSDGKPIAVAARGTAEIRSWLGVLVKTFRLSGQEIDSTLIDGASAAVHWRARIHSRVTGATVPTELIDLIETDGRRIRSFQELFVPAG